MSNLDKNFQWLEFLSSPKTTELLKSHPHHCPNCGEDWKCYGSGCTLGPEAPCERTECEEALMWEHWLNTVDQERERILR